MNRIIVAAVALGVTSLTGCNSRADGSAALGGLSASDREQIAAQALADLRQRRWDRAGGMKPGTLCTDVFDLGTASISDVSLGPATGKVQVNVPITASRPYEFPGTGVYLIPDQECWGIPPQRWPRGPLPVAFEFNIERWASGWRVSQVQ
jgi:hypothetical protein